MNTIDVKIRRYTTSKFVSKMDRKYSYKDQKAHYSTFTIKKILKQFKYENPKMDLFH